MIHYRPNGILSSKSGHYRPSFWRSGRCATLASLPKRILNSNRMNSRLPISYFCSIKSFRNFVQSTTRMSLCIVQNFKRVGISEKKLWANEISRDLCLIWVSGRYATLQYAPYYLLNSQRIAPALFPRLSVWIYFTPTDIENRIEFACVIEHSVSRLYG